MTSLRPGVCRALCALALLLTALCAPVGGRAGVNAWMLEQRIEELAAAIGKTQRKDGSMGGRARQWAVGETALGVLALRAAGRSTRDGVVRGGAEFLLANDDEAALGTYQVALRVMALESVDAAAYRDEIAEGAEYLMRAQQGSGGWSYRTRGQTDNSNSQFAVLGLNSAALAGVEVPREVWQSARSYFAAAQNADGGWAYRARSGPSYGSMTAAGLASLYMCDMWTHAAGGRCGVYPDERRVRAGLNWLGRNFSVTKNPGHEMWKFYYLYGLERAGVTLARRYFGRHDWYREGVEHLVGDPPPIVIAPSQYEWGYLRDCLSLLFLAKGNAPVVMFKAQWPGNWEHYRYDARFLTHYLARVFERQLDWQIVPLEAELAQLMASPVLYVSGDGALTWTPEQRRRLRQYVDAGGFVLVDCARGEPDFDASLRELLREQFPDQALEPLPAEHPIYSAHFEIPRNRRPRLEAVQGPCWISLLYAPDGLACEWDVAAFDHAHFKMGANIIAYVTGMEKLEGKLTEPQYYLPGEREAAPRRGAFTLGQLVHGTHWRPHKLAWRRVLELVNERAGLEVYSEPLAIRADVESPFQAQMIYVTGVEGIELNAETRRALKLYLERGGFIFAEAACGSKEFDEDFRRLLRTMFPQEELRPLPLGHPLFHLGEELGEVKYSPAVRRASPELMRPQLEFIERDGRAVLIYSRYDLSSAIEGHPCYSCPAVLEPSASRLAVTIVLYGLSS